MTTLMGGAFVGRQREMGKLKAVLKDALSGQGQLLMLVGEPGIGKTRTAQELAAYAETRDAQILWGWCYEEEGAPPFWPWLQPIRSYVQQRDPKHLQSEMGPGAADIAEVVSEVRGKLPGLDPPPALQPEQARFRLFDSITTFWKNAAQSQPLMLVLDDLHWADKPSLLLLQFLARQLTESHLLVVGCYRDVELSRQHPLSEALAQLSRLPVFQRELLLGMSQEDSGQFIEMTAGIRPSPQLVETIHAHTEGNPFFLKGMTRLLSERGELKAPEIGGPEGIRMPQGVREVIGQRLNRLSESCHETLTTASIIGREFDFRLLRTLNDETTDEQLLGVIDEALAARLVEELPGGRERYRFSHALIQQTLAEELSSSRKVRWHARIGEALEELYGVDGEAHAAELAYHFAKAEPVLGPEKLVRYSLLAGEGALATFAWEEALQHFQRGLVPKQDLPIDKEIADILFGIGIAKAAIADFSDALDAWNKLTLAFDYFIHVGEIERAVSVATYPLPLIGFVSGAWRMAARAIEMVAAGSNEAGQLLSRYGFALYLERGDYNAGKEALAKALIIAQQRNNQALAARTLPNMAALDVFECNFEESLKSSLDAVKVGELTSDLFALMRAHYWAAWAQIALGDTVTAHVHAAQAVLIAEKVSDRIYQTRSLFLRSSIAGNMGNWASAQLDCDLGLELSPNFGWLLAQKALIHYQVGEYDKGDTYTEKLLRSIVNLPFVVRAVSLTTYLTGNSRWAKEAENASQELLGSSLFEYEHACGEEGLALLAVSRRDVSECRQHLSGLAKRKGTMLPAGGLCADRLLSLLFATLGNLEEASTHFEDALTFCRQAGYRPELAWTCYDYAEALLQRSHPGDHAKAMALLEESLAISQELGMRPLAERVAILQQQSQPRSLRAAYPDSLTQREVEVLHLIALGKSNRQIAEGLFISLNTVERHVSNIFAKTRTSNRADATRYAIRNGLVA